MHQNILIPLPGFTLPYSLPWSTGFVELVDLQLRRLRSTGHYVSPRFFGYYFEGTNPVGIAGSWTVGLDPNKATKFLQLDHLEKLTHGKYSIVGTEHTTPDFVLIHDCFRRDGHCWLWSFPEGLRFIESLEPVILSQESHTPRRLE